MKIRTGLADMRIRKTDDLGNRQQVALMNGLQRNSIRKELAKIKAVEIIKLFFNIWSVTRKDSRPLGDITPLPVIKIKTYEAYEYAKNMRQLTLNKVYALVLVAWAFSKLKLVEAASEAIQTAKSVNTDLQSSKGAPSERSSFIALLTAEKLVEIGKTTESLGLLNALRDSYDQYGKIETLMLK